MSEREEKKYTFQLTGLELQVILKGLREVPYKESANLIFRLVESYDQQNSQEVKKE